MLRLPYSIHSALPGARRQLSLLCCASADSSSSAPGPPARRRRRATSLSQQQQLLQDELTGLQSKSNTSLDSSTALVNKKNSKTGSRGKTGSLRPRTSRSQTAAIGNQVTLFVLQHGCVVSPTCAAAQQTVLFSSL
jgi:hypothetical protein